MTQPLRWEQFETLLHQKFSLSYHPDQSPLELELLELAEKKSIGGNFTGFHVIWGSGLDEVKLPQGNWKLKHPDWGEKTLFMVPAGPKGDHFTYCVSISYKEPC